MNLRPAWAAQRDLYKNTETFARKAPGVMGFTDESSKLKDTVITPRKLCPQTEWEGTFPK